MCIPLSVPRYRSKWQDHVGTSVLRCRPLASYVPLCSDLSESVSCTAACIGDSERISNQRFLRYDGSTPGPFPLICPTQRILNSCCALIKYRRVQTSLRRIIIRSESCLAERHRACQLQFLYRKSIIGEMRACLLQSQDTGASDRTM